MKQLHFHQEFMIVKILMILFTKELGKYQTQNLMELMYYLILQHIRYLFN